MSDPEVTARDRALTEYRLDDITIRLAPWRVELQQGGNVVVLQPKDAAAARTLAVWLKEGMKHLLSLSNVLASVRRAG